MGRSAVFPTDWQRASSPVGESHEPCYGRQNRDRRSANTIRSSRTPPENYSTAVVLHEEPSAAVISTTAASE